MNLAHISLIQRAKSSNKSLKHSISRTIIDPFIIITIKDSLIPLLLFHSHRHKYLLKLIEHHGHFIKKSCSLFKKKDS